MAGLPPSSPDTAAREPHIVAVGLSAEAQEEEEGPAGTGVELAQYEPACDEPPPNSSITNGFTALRRAYLRCPIVSLLLVHVAATVAIVVLWSDVTIGDDMERLAYAGTNASLYREAYLHAWTDSDYAPTRPRMLDLPLALAGNPEGLPPGEQAEIWGEAGRSLSSVAPGFSHAHFSLHFLYKMEDGDILQERPLYAVRQFEERLRNLPGWQRLCRQGGPAAADGGETLSASCDPGESLVSFAWPEREHGIGNCTGLGCSTERLTFNGRGSQWLPVDVGFSSLLGSSGEVLDRLRRFLPVTALPKGIGESVSSDVIQSHFLFSLPHTYDLAHTSSYSDEADALEEFRLFVDDELRPMLQEPFEPFEQRGIQVYVQGAEMYRSELFRQFSSDCCWAIGSMLLVLLVVGFLTRRPAVVFAVLTVSVESVLLGFVIVRKMFGSPDASILLTTVVFVVPALGLESLLAVASDWGVANPGPSLHRQGSLDAAWAVDKCSHAARVVLPRWWLNSDGPVSVASLLCACSGFFASLLCRSLLVREVGLLLGLSVLLQLCLSALTYPPLLVLLEQIGVWRARRRAGGADAVSLIEASGAAVGDAGGEDAAPGAPSAQGSSALLRASPLDKAVAWLASWWATVLERYAPIVMLCSAVWLLIVMVCALVQSRSSSEVPALFSSCSSQAMGLALLSRFDPEAAIPTASSAALQDARIVDVAEPRITDVTDECHDEYVSCGGWAAMGACSGQVGSVCKKSCGQCTYSFARACLLEEAPSSKDQAPECTCHDPAGSELDARVDQPRSAALQIRAMVAGLPAEAWPLVEENLTLFFQGFAPVAGGGVEQASGYNLGNLSGNLTFLSDVATQDPLSTRSSAWEQPPLVQMHWRSGAFAVRQMFEAPTFSIISYPQSIDLSVLEIDEVKELRLFCYCGGVNACSTVRAETLESRWNISYSDPSEDPSNLSSTTSAPASGSGSLDPTRGREHPLLEARATLGTPGPAHVTVVWGLGVKDPWLLDAFAQSERPWQEWEFDALFEASDPWAQRAMMGIYDHLPADLHAQPEDARVTWPHEFENWLWSRGLPFPSKNFHADIEMFLGAHPHFGENFILVEGEVRAVRAGFLLTVTNEVDATEADELKGRWDAYVEERNRQGGLHASRAWHTSSLWVRMESRRSLVSSAGYAFLIVFGIGVAVTGLLTWSPGVTMCVAGCTINSMLTLLSVILAWMGWPLGFMEFVPLAAAGGRAFMPCFLLAHAYARAPLDQMLAACEEKSDEVARPSTSATSYAEATKESLFRTRYALESQLPRVLALLFVDFWCSVCLLCCRLELFVTFGAFGAIGAIAANVNALVLLPALLCEVGPTSQNRPVRSTMDGCWDCCLQCLAILERMQTASERAWEDIMACLNPPPAPRQPEPARAAQAQPRPQLPPPRRFDEDEDEDEEESARRFPPPPPPRAGPASSKGPAGHGAVISSGGSTLLNSAGRRRAPSSSQANSESGAGAGGGSHSGARQSECPAPTPPASGLQPALPADPAGPAILELDDDLPPPTAPEGERRGALPLRQSTRPLTPGVEEEFAALGPGLQPALPADPAEPAILELDEDLPPPAAPEGERRGVQPLRQSTGPLTPGVEDEFAVLGPGLGVESPAAAQPTEWESAPSPPEKAPQPDIFPPAEKDSGDDIDDLLADLSGGDQ